MNILVKYETNLKMCVKVRDIYLKRTFHEKLIIVNSMNSHLKHVTSTKHDPIEYIEAW